MASKYEIAFVSGEQVKELLKLRYRIYVREMGLFRESADHDSGVLEDASDASARFLAVSVDSKIVAGMRLHVGKDCEIPRHYIDEFDVERFSGVVSKEGVCIMSRLTVLPEYRRGRLTFDLFLWLHEWSIRNGIELVFVDCATHLMNIYLQLGFRRYREIIADPEFGILVPFVMIIRDFEYFDSIDSPFRNTTLRAAQDNAFIQSVRNLIPGEYGRQSELTGRSSRYWEEAFSSINRGVLQGEESIFAGMPSEEVAGFLSRSHRLKVANGGWIIHKGTSADSVYVMLSGAAEVLDGDRKLALIGPGDLFGEVGFFIGIPRTADIKAATDDVELLVLDRGTLGRLIENDSVATAKFLRNALRSVCRKFAERTGYMAD